MNTSPNLGNTKRKKNIRSSPPKRFFHQTCIIFFKVHLKKGTETKRMTLIKLWGSNIWATELEFRHEHPGNWLVHKSV